MFIPYFLGGAYLPWKLIGLIPKEELQEQYAEEIVNFREALGACRDDIINSLDKENKLFLDMLKSDSVPEQILKEKSKELFASLLDCKTCIEYTRIEEKNKLLKDFIFSCFLLELFIDREELETELFLRFNNSWVVKSVISYRLKDETTAYDNIIGRIYYIQARKEKKTQQAYCYYKHAELCGYDCKNELENGFISSEQPSSIIWNRINVQAVKK